MKLKIFFFILPYFISRSAFSQNSSIAEIDKTIEQMKNQKDAYEKIEKIKSENAYKYVYFKDNEVQIISINEKDKIEKNVEWFYLNNNLIYTETNWLNIIGGKKLFTEKTYHVKGNLIAWLKSENTFVDASSTEFKKMDKDLGAYAIKIRNEALE